MGAYRRKEKFSRLEELIPDQGELALQLVVNEDGEIEVEKYCLPRNGNAFSKEDTRDLFLQSSMAEVEKNQPGELKPEDKRKLNTYFRQAFEKDKREQCFQAFTQRTAEDTEKDTSAEPRKAP